MSGRFPVLCTTFMATEMPPCLSIVAAAQTRNHVHMLAKTPKPSCFVPAMMGYGIAWDMRIASENIPLAFFKDPMPHLHPAIVGWVFLGQEGSHQADLPLAPSANIAHVGHGERGADAMNQPGNLHSIAGMPLGVSASGNAVTGKGANDGEVCMIGTDIACSRRAVHVINTVLPI